MSHAYSEDQLVEQPAIGIFPSLGWQTTSATEETFSIAQAPCLNPMHKRLIQRD